MFPFDDVIMNHATFATYGEVCFTHIDYDKPIYP